MSKTRQPAPPSQGKTLFTTYFFKAGEQPAHLHVWKEPCFLDFLVHEGVDCARVWAEGVFPYARVLPLACIGRAGMSLLWNEYHRRGGSTVTARGT